jgi:hypothetical protein
MERRGSDRIRRRVPCTFRSEDQAHEAMVTDVSTSGLFLQTDAGLALGSELTLQLRDPACGEIEVRGRVVRRRFTPAVIARWIRRGVGVQILAAPERYREVLTGGEPAPDAAWSALQDLGAPFEPPAPVGAVSLDIAVDAAPACAVAPEPEREPEPVLAAEPPPAPPVEIAAEALLAQAEPEPPPDAAEPPPLEIDVPREDDRLRFEERVRADAEPEPPPARAPSAAPPPSAAPQAAWSPPALCRADALLIHDGELADVESLLDAMGADTVRQSTIEPSGFTGWEKPPRLIVASGRSALRLSMGTNVEGQGVVTIAVVDSESQTLCGMLRRQGFRYVVRRPVHPEALRLLLGRSLFRGRERRDNARVSLGCEVALRFGLRRRSATLLELSRTGCRLLLPEWAEPGARLSVRIPAPVTGNRPLILVGRVLRSERQRRPNGGHDVAAALRFDRLDAGGRARLDALIAAHTLGPTPLERGETAPRAAAKSEPRARAAAAATPGAGAPPAPPSAEPVERRRGPRAPHRREVIALEPELARVRHTLLGIDLSAGGIRVEPHPDLAVGDRVRIAIYDAAVGDSLVVDAEAVRDQGARGVVLHFRGLSEETRRRIEQIVQSAPQIESAGAEEGAGVVVAEMLAQQPA